MRILLVSAFFIVVQHLSAQQDYFYAENLVDQGKHAEAIRVLDQLIDSGVYADRPRFAMMTMNLAGNQKGLMKDTAGAMKCFRRAMQFYDTLSGPRKSDDWNRREYYRAGSGLVVIYFAQQNYAEANKVLLLIGEPGEYYSATGSDVLHARIHHHRLRAMIFEKTNQPDSAFHCILQMRDNENYELRGMHRIFDSVVHHIEQVMFIPYPENRLRSTNQSAGYLYCVQATANDGSPYSFWCLNRESGGFQLVAGSSDTSAEHKAFPGAVNALSLSPAHTWLAVECSGNKQSRVEIVNMETIVSEYRYEAAHRIQPQGGNVKLIGWEQSQLLIESDFDLLLLNKKVPFNKPELFVATGDNRKYLYDPETGKYSKK